MSPWIELGVAGILATLGVLVARSADRGHKGVIDEHNRRRSFDLFLDEHMMADILPVSTTSTKETTMREPVTITFPNGETLTCSQSSLNAIARAAQLAHDEGDIDYQDDHQEEEVGSILEGLLSNTQS